jgi:hypothetical protein
MKMTYTGVMSDASGLYCVIENVVLSEFIDKLPSVNDLFSYAPTSARLGVDTIEVVYRPDEPGVETFKDENDTCCDVGATGTISSVGETARLFEPRGICIAYKGMVAGQSSDLSIELVKNVEWRAETGVGFMSTPPVSMGAPMNKVVLQGLDAAHPGWAHRTAGAVSSEIGTLAKAVFAGVGSVARPVLNSIGNAVGAFGAQKLVGYATSRAPYLALTL